MILAAEVTVSTTGIVVACTILGAVWVLVQVGDRLWWSKPAQKLAQEQSVKCQYDHLRILDSEGRMEQALTKLAESQKQLMMAMKSFTESSAHHMELARIRHSEIMKSLELIERRLQLNSGDPNNGG